LIAPLLPGPKLKAVRAKIARGTMENVTRSDVAKGLEVLPRRWVVKRTFAWLGRGRHLAKDWEKTIRSAEPWLRLAHIRRITRLLART